MNSIIIKKYNNRRLYNTLEKKYITLEELAETIRSGYTVEVIDNQTKEDITQETLLQIILNEGKEKSIFSSKLLHQIIQLQKDKHSEFLQFYLGCSLDSYIQLKDGMQQQFSLWNQWLNMGNLPNQMMQNTWEKLQETLQSYEKKIHDLEEKIKNNEK